MISSPRTLVTISSPRTPVTISNPRSLAPATKKSKGVRVVLFDVHCGGYGFCGGVYAPAVLKQAGGTPFWKGSILSSAGGSFVFWEGGLFTHPRAGVSSFGKWSILSPTGWSFVFWEGSLFSHPRAGVLSFGKWSILSPTGGSFVFWEVIYSLTNGREVPPKRERHHRRECAGGDDGDGRDERAKHQ
eukprot:scaffold10319_cov84-Isochrysis_galbana.AAC.1